MKRLLNGLVYLSLGFGFAYAWMSPLRPGAEPWILGAIAVVIVELPVAVLIGPVLLAATKDRKPGIARLLAPGALLLQGAAYVILYYLWRAESAPLQIGLGYAATVALRCIDLASSGKEALVLHTARMMVWFASIVLAMLATLVLSIAGAAAGASSVSWAVKICALYFLFLAAGEALLPQLRRAIEPGLQHEDRSRPSV
jgi:hypothetical protein